jgi:hypothetical protein
VSAADSWRKSHQSVINLGIHLPSWFGGLFDSSWEKSHYKARNIFVLKQRFWVIKNIFSLSSPWIYLKKKSHKMKGQSKGVKIHFISELRNEASRKIKNLHWAEGNWNWTSYH